MTTSGKQRMHALSVALLALLFFTFAPTAEAQVPGQETNSAIASAAQQHCDDETGEECNILFVARASGTDTPSQQAACTGIFVEEAFSRTVGGINTYYNYCYSLDANEPPIIPPADPTDPRDPEGGINAICAGSPSCERIIFYEVAADNETSQRERCTADGGIFVSRGHTTGGGSTGFPLTIYSYCYAEAQNAGGGSTGGGGLFATPDYVPLVGIPGIEDPASMNLVDYLNRIYVLIIIFGSLAAVIKIGVAGAQWAMTDVVTGKEAAKANIKGSLIGLAIILGTYIVLYAINPQLTSLDVLRSVEILDLPTNRTAPGGNKSGPVTRTTDCVVGKEAQCRSKCNSLGGTVREENGSVACSFDSSNMSAQQLYIFECQVSGGTLSSVNGNLSCSGGNISPDNNGGGGQVCTDPLADLREPKNFGNCNGPSGGGDAQRVAWEGKCAAAGGTIEVNIPWDRCWYNHTCSNLPPKEQVQICGPTNPGGDGGGDPYASLRGPKERTASFESSCERAGGLVNWSLDSPVTECVGLPYYPGVAPTNFVQNRFTGKTHLNNDEKARYEALERFHRQECAAHGGTTNRTAGGGQYYYLNCSIF